MRAPLTCSQDWRLPMATWCSYEELGSERASSKAMDL